MRWGSGVPKAISTCTLLPTGFTHIPLMGLTRSTCLGDLFVAIKRMKNKYYITNLLFYCILRSVRPVSVNAPVSVNVDNNRTYRSSYCKRVYNNSTVRVNVDTNGRALPLLPTFTLTGVCDDNMCDVNAFC